MLTTIWIVSGTTVLSLMTNKSWGNSLWGGAKSPLFKDTESGQDLIMHMWMDIMGPGALEHGSWDKMTQLDTMWFYESHWRNVEFG